MYAVEFWGNTNADQSSCQLSDYPRQMSQGPTVNLVANKLVACWDLSCDIYQEGAWNHLQDMIVGRRFHSSVSLGDKVLLIGGTYSRSTEFIWVDGSGASPGPFTVRHGYEHCTMKINEDVIVVTGGGHVDDKTESLVTMYQLSDGRETALTPLTQGRYGQQVSGEVQTRFVVDCDCDWLCSDLNFEEFRLNISMNCLF